MVTQATKELIALLNVMCGGLVFLGLLIYLARARPRRGAVIAAALAVVFFCLLNSLVVYFVV
jgi:hypothetical protein